MGSQKAVKRLVKDIVASLRKALPVKEEREKDFEPMSDDELRTQLLLFASRVICRKIITIASPFETMPPLHRNEEVNPKMKWIAETVKHTVVKPIVAHPSGEHEKYRILGLVNTALAPHIEKASIRSRPY